MYAQVYYTTITNIQAYLQPKIQYFIQLPRVHSDPAIRYIIKYAGKHSAP